MSDQFVGEIRMFGGRYAPLGWFPCDGRLLPISEFEALFTLIGTTYGGDGQSTFGLPDLRSRVPIHQGTYQGITYVLGETGGFEDVTLIKATMASHGHPLGGSTNPATSNTPANQVPASLSAAGTQRVYDTLPPLGAIDPGSVGFVGNGQSHTNIQPYMGLNFIVAYDGIYPPPGAAGEREGSGDE